MPVDPMMGVGGAEWRIAPVEGAGAVDGAAAPGAPGAAGGFATMLGDAIGSLARTQTEASAGAQSLAAGTATDPTAVVMAVEKAQLSMQLASQVRNKLVEAAQDIFHTQI